MFIYFNFICAQEVWSNALQLVYTFSSILNFFWLYEIHEVSDQMCVWLMRPLVRVEAHVDWLRSHWTSIRSHSSYGSLMWFLWCLITTNNEPNRLSVPSLCSVYVAIAFISLPGTFITPGYRHYHSECVCYSVQGNIVCLSVCKRSLWSISKDFAIYLFS